MSGRNLRKMYQLATDADIAEGLLAYGRYNKVIQMFADEYGVSFERTLSAFVALSPNNDYFGNLRSLASVLAGYRAGRPVEDITISTYNHCRDRAFLYVTGERDFLATSKGLKIRSFYYNILTPDCPKHVTIDGHMKAAYEGEALTMKEAIVGTKGEYHRIANAAKRLAKLEGMLPNQIQAVIWFTRKRVFEIKYQPQLSLFGDHSDTWRTVITPAEALPY